MISPHQIWVPARELFPRKVERYSAMPSGLAMHRQSNKSHSAGGDPVLQESVVGVWPLTANGNDGSPNALHLSAVGGSLSYSAEGVEFANTNGDLAQDPYLKLTGGIPIGDNSFFLVGQVKVTTIGSYGFGMFYDTNDEISFNVAGAGALECYITGNGDLPDVLSNNGDITVGTRFTCFAWGDKDLDKIYCQINGSTIFELDAPGPWIGTTGDVLVGAYNDTLQGTGYLRYLALWKGDISALDAAARTWLRTTWDGTYAGLAAYTP